MPTLFTRMSRSPRGETGRHVRLVHYAWLALAAAFWPVVPWYVARTGDGSDDPFGVLALLAALVILWQARHSLQVTPLGICLAGALVSVNLLLHPVLPPLVEALLAVAALGCVFRLWQRQAGVMALLALSLPVVASAQFFLGYPLRWITAKLSQGLLMLAGLETELQGTQLCWGMQQVGVDPPCSGVRMLWAGLFAAALLSAKGGLSWRSTSALLIGGTLLALMANALRAGLLFPSEAGLMTLPAGVHEGVGLLVFALLLWVLLRWQERLAKTPERPEPPASTPDFARHAMIGLLGLGLVTGTLRLHPPEAPGTNLATLPTWPELWQGQPLEALALTTREQAFAESFPGQLARFRCGDSELILRQVHRATRALHSSRDCFQASGYEVESQGLWTDAQGQAWFRFTATRSSERLNVSERIYAPDGRCWTDVGAWFWSALFHADTGPWMAATVIEAARPALALAK